MVERRSKHDIIYDILKAIQDKHGSIKPTHLLYKSNLSHEGMKRYIAELKESGLLKEEEDEKTGKKKYVITEKGCKFLEMFPQMKEFTSSFGI